MSCTDNLDRALGALTGDERDHYERLVASTSLLADISFADILVLVPLPGSDCDGVVRATPPDGGDVQFVVTAHSRSMTNETVHPNDLLGRRIPSADRPLGALALRTGASVNGGAYLADQDRWVQSLAVPVNHADRTIAVLLREFPAVSGRVWGRLEKAYFALFRRLAWMIADGVYPYATTPGDHNHLPRVGDGLVLLDAHQRVEYLTPNAHSTLRRLGSTDDPTGGRLAQSGIEPRAIRLTASTCQPNIEEINRNGHSVVVRCLPLIQEDTLTGMLVLMRDITELRRTEQLLITKNAALAEVHHRIKNNLQTVSSLLSLQSRWLEEPEGKAALAESARRLHLIAAVHEILTAPDGENTTFESLVATLSSLLRESLAPPGAPISIKVKGTVGPLPSEVMTTMAIVLNELVQNAVDHGFRLGAAGDEPGNGRFEAIGSGLRYPSRNEIEIRIDHYDAELHMSVTDNGVGRPEGPLPEGPLPEGLGLTLVRTLVENDLGGSIAHRSSPDGTTVELTAPLAAGAPRATPPRTQNRDLLGSGEGVEASDGSSARLARQVAEAEPSPAR